MAGGEADGFGLVDPAVLGVREPGVELSEGGGGEIDVGERGLFVLRGLRGGRLGARGDCGVVS